MAKRLTCRQFFGIRSGLCLPVLFSQYTKDPFHSDGVLGVCNPTEQRAHVSMVTDIGCKGSDHETVHCSGTYLAPLLHFIYFYSVALILARLFATASRTQIALQIHE